MNVFFLFGGTRPRRKCFAQGTFRCPRCGSPARYERCRAAEWVHLYWIPLFRLGREEEVIVCTACGAVMEPGVVDRGASPRTSGGGGDPGDRITWTCDRCGNVNPRGAVACLACGAAP